MSNKNLATLLIIISLILLQSYLLAQQDDSLKIQWEKVKYNADKLRDPFGLSAPPIEKPIEDPMNITHKSIDLPLPNLEVQGIVWSNKASQAIINDKILRIGDEIDNVRITDINKKGVTVFFQGQTYVLTPRVYGSNSTLNIVNVTSQGGNK